MTEILRCVGFNDLEHAMRFQLDSASGGHIIKNIQKTVGEKNAQ